MYRRCKRGYCCYLNTSQFGRVAKWEDNMFEITIRYCINFYNINIVIIITKYRVGTHNRNQILPKTSHKQQIRVIRVNVTKREVTQAAGVDSKIDYISHLDR